MPAFIPHLIIAAACIGACAAVIHAKNPQLAEDIKEAIELGVEFFKEKRRGRESPLVGYARAQQMRQAQEEEDELYHTPGPGFELKERTSATTAETTAISVPGATTSTKRRRTERSRRSTPVKENSSSETENVETPETTSVTEIETPSETSSEFSEPEIVNFTTADELEMSESSVKTLKPASQL